MKTYLYFKNDLAGQHRFINLMNYVFIHQESFNDVKFTFWDSGITVYLEYNVLTKNEFYKQFLAK